MSVYSIALPRCPFFLKRRKYSKAKGLRPDSVHMSPDDWLVVSYRSADAEAVTRITVFALSFVCVGLATAFELPI
jgi:hypothetical protein